MVSLFVRRLWQLIPAFVGLTLLAFLLVKLAPGVPTLGSSETGSGRDLGNSLAAWRHLHGDDAPLWQQYGTWLWAFVRLDFGRSLIDEQPVRDLLFQALPTTLLLSGSALVLTYALAVPLGIFSAHTRHTLIDRVVTATLFVFYSVPSFWLALVLLVLLAGDAQAPFPLRGLQSDGMAQAGFWLKLVDLGWHLALPVVCLALPAIARTARYQRAAALDVMGQEFITVARANGLSEQQILRRHVLPNSLLPMLTLLSVDLPWLVGGSVIIERIFTLRGMGMLTFEAVLRRDYPVLMGTTALVVMVTMLGLLLGDVALTWADPRLRPTHQVHS